MGTVNGVRNFNTNLETKLIVNEYFQRQFNEKGVVWTPGFGNEGGNHPNHQGNHPNQLEQPSYAAILQNDQGTMRQSLINRISLLSRDLMDSYGESIVERVEQAALELPSNAGEREAWAGIGDEAFTGVADELFAEGIRWNHILTLFVFSSELAYLYGVRKNRMELVDDVAIWFASYLNRRVIGWINEHSGWNGFIEYANSHHPVGERELGLGVGVRNGNRPSEQHSSSEENFWTLKKLIGVGGAVGVIGAAITIASFLLSSKQIST